MMMAAGQVGCGDGAGLCKMLIVCLCFIEVEGSESAHFSWRLHFIDV